MPSEVHAYAHVTASNEDYVLRVYGDSLSLPRAFEGISPRETFPEILARELSKAFPRLNMMPYNRSGGGLTIRALHERYLHDCSYFGSAAGQVIIIQCGIVDCAPRPVPSFVRALIGTLHGRIRVPISKVLHAARPYLLSVGLSWRLTRPKRFASTLRRWLDHATRHHDRVYVINIAPTTDPIAAHSPSMDASIGEYNRLIAGIVSAVKDDQVALVDVNNAIQSSGAVTAYINETDGHHITRAGHQLYANLVLRMESKRLSQGHDYGTGEATSKVVPL